MNESIRHLGVKEAPQTTWLTPYQVMGFEGISHREVYRRMKPGDPRFLISKDRKP